MKENFSHSNKGGITEITAMAGWTPEELSQYLNMLHEEGLPLQKIILDLSKVNSFPDIAENSLAIAKKAENADEASEIVKEIIFIGNDTQLEGMGMLALAIPEISSGVSVKRIK